MRVDHGRARFIAGRLRDAGDTPAAELIEQLLAEREQLLFRAPGGELIHGRSCWTPEHLPEPSYPPIIIPNPSNPEDR
ncbi:MAG TPA: hypothetical protein VK966_04955 [Longimicrobiales bacterium]|nr:hypothetical protein [Longimicrobiales bacterium]